MCLAGCPALRRGPRTATGQRPSNISFCRSASLISSCYLLILGVNVKFHALCQRQRTGIIDGCGHAAHVIFPAIAARNAATTRDLFTAKGPANFCAAGADVDIGDAAITAIGGLETL